MKKMWFILSALVIVFSINLIFAENLEIQIKNNYLPGEDVIFKIILYDDSGNKVDGNINFAIQNYYTDVVADGSILSGQETVFKLPESAWRGYWAIIAKYNDIE